MSAKALSLAIFKSLARNSRRVHLENFKYHFKIDKSPLVGGIPGVTKRVASTKVVSNPDVYMIDTPGIFVPDVKDAEVGLKMALCGIYGLFIGNT